MTHLRGCGFLFLCPTAWRWLCPNSVILSNKRVEWSNQLSIPRCHRRVRRYPGRGGPTLNIKAVLFSFFKLIPDTHYQTIFQVTAYTAHRVFLSLKPYSSNRVLFGNNRVIKTSYSGTFDSLSFINPKKFCFTKVLSSSSRLCSCLRNCSLNR